MHKLSAHLLFLSVLAAVSSPLLAEVTRFELTEREPFAGGKAFGAVGAYERIVGRIHFELDPNLRQNRNVIDLKLAPHNDRGRVELFADLIILAPKDLSKGNGALLYGVNNRGNLGLLRHFNYASGSNNPTDDKHAGDGFLMRHGFTVVWSGWDGELLPGNGRLRLSPPKVTGNITGNVRCEIVPSGDTKIMLVNWSNHGSYRPTAEGIKTATLTHRLLAGHPRVPIPREDWTLHVTDVESDSPTQLPRVELEYPAGLRKLHIYELIYEAQDPVVMGTCFTSVRDLVAALKHGSGQSNPLLVEGKSSIRRAYSYGVSQSGRFLREMAYWDFNVDEQGRKVFDGIIPHVSGSGLGSFNHRFAQPTRHAGQHDHHDYPPDRFPFAYDTQTDPLSGLSEGILDRAQRSDSAPLVMHTQSSSEYWNRSGSLVHTDPLGTRDAEIPENVRIYFFGGTQHGPSGFTTNTGDGQTAPNPADYRPFVRALLLALDHWAKDGTDPPPSAYPRIGDGTLVAWTQKGTGFPNIPGIRYPQVIQQPSFLDFGPRWQEQRIVDKQPPLPRGDYRVLVPRSDPDGNELGCLSAPEVAVPVATYTSWRLRKADGPAANQLYSLSGSYIPFPTTKNDRETSGDPRQSVEERYGTLDRYLKQLEAQCRKYELAGYMLPEDTQRTLSIQRKRVEPLFKAIATELAPGPNPPQTPEEKRAHQRKVGPKSKLKTLASRPLAREVAAASKLAGPTPGLPRSRVDRPGRLSSIFALSQSLATMVAADVAETKYVQSADGKRPKPIVAVKNVCAWPNLTMLRDGTIVATIHNQPSHLKLPSDVECWASVDGGISWAKRGTPAPRDTPRTARGNVAAGLANNGDLIVIASGWSDPTAKSDRGSVLRPIVSRSTDGGRSWSIDTKAFSQITVPFGDILAGGDGKLRVGVYRGEPGTTMVYSSPDDGKTWVEPVTINQDVVIHEPALFHLGKGKWLAAARFSGLTLYASDDDAKTWALRKSLTGPQQHPGHFVRLKDGRVMLSYGNRVTPKGVDVRFSDDEGLTWSEPFRVVDFQGDGGYPSSVQLKDGKVLTAYYARQIEGHDGYHMGAVIWDPGKTGKR